MKIQCDVCNKDEASVYCSADEAALCATCDHRVHHANKLAGKHPRFSLLLPSPRDAPLCDICNEKRAFLFCQQDRAILCKDCDIPIHKVNEHTQKHNRFLLTGVKLSATSSLYSSPSSAASLTNTGCDVVVPDLLNSQKPISNKNPVYVPSAIPNPPSMGKTATATNGEKGSRNSNQLMDGSDHGSTTSSISEYLIEMLPGWHVEDFLDSPSGFCKTGDNGVMPFWDGDLLDGNLSTFSSANMGMWVPQPQPQPSSPLQDPASIMGFGGQMGSKELPGSATNTIKSSRKWRSDYGNCFTVPQISPPSTSKRQRNLW